MKRMGMWFLAAALAAPLGFASPASGATGQVVKTTNVLLVCKGGPKMHMIYTLRYQPIPMLDIFFERAPKGATKEAPGPGQCARKDLPLSANEPNRFHVRLADGRIKFQIDFGKIKVLSIDDVVAKILFLSVHGGGLFGVHADWHVNEKVWIIKNAFPYVP